METLYKTFEYKGWRLEHTKIKKKHFSSRLLTGKLIDKDKLFIHKVADLPISFQLDIGIYYKLKITNKLMEETLKIISSLCEDYNNLDGIKIKNDGYSLYEFDPEPIFKQLNLEYKYPILWLVYLFK